MNQLFVRKSPVDKPGSLMETLTYKYLPYWPLFLLFTLVAAVGGWFYLQYTTPLYEIRARLLVKDQNKGSEDSKTVEDLNLVATKKIIENEIEVIQSQDLLDAVSKRLTLYAPVFETNKLRNTSAYLSSPIIIEAPDPAILKSSKPVPFSYDAVNSLVTLGDKQFPIHQLVKTPYGNLKFLPNRYYRGQKVTDLYFQLENQKDVISSLQSRLAVSAVNKQSSIISLVLKDAVPERGEDILNELIISYATAGITEKQALAEKTLAFVENRLATVQRDLELTEQKNQRYKSGRDAIDIGEQGRLFLQNVSANDQKIADINMQMAALEQVEKYVSSPDRTGSILPSIVGVTDPLLSQLVTKLYSTELEAESLKKTTAENNPAMLALTDQIKKIKPGIIENVRNQRLGLEASRKNLAGTNNAYSGVLQRLPEKERQLIQINREQNIKNEIYSFLLQKREEAALAQASTVADSKIIDKASSSSRPVSPKAKIIYLSALIVALIASTAFVTTKEALAKNVLFRYEIEKLTAQPIVGEIIAHHSPDAIVIGDNSKTFIAEQFRRLRLSLSSLGINSHNKRILVTSAIGGEGKSFVALNLALSLGLTDKKVVIVDADLNNPSLHKKIGMENLAGVTEFLSSSVSAESVARRTQHNRNLFFISAGKLPDNPSELIMNGRMEELLQSLELQFDYIIVDTAPVSPVTDAYILSPMFNATLFVIRHRYTPKVYVQRIDEESKVNQLRNMAIVFNGISSRGYGSENYGYGYGYGYIHKDSNYHLRLDKA